jgi:hypothetical protein
MANTATKGGKQQGQQGGGPRDRDGRKDQGARPAEKPQQAKGAPGETGQAEEPNLGQKRGWSVGSEGHGEHEGSAPAGNREHGDRKR